MSPPDLTQQDDDLPAAETERDARRKDHDYGNWPEVLGAVFTLMSVWFLFQFRG